MADNIERILHDIAQDFFRAAMLLVIAFVSMYYVNPVFFLTLALWFAFAKAGFAFNEPDFIKHAHGAAAFVLQTIADH